MRAKLLVNTMLVCLLALGAYSAGHYKGKCDTLLAMENANAHGSIANFRIATSALEKIRASEPEAAERLLLTYAQLQLPLLEYCVRSPSCALSNGRVMPSEQERQKIAQLAPLASK